MSGTYPSAKPRYATSQRGGIFFKLIFLLGLVVFCFFLYIARSPLLRLAGGFWVVDETPKPSDAIVMLSDDNYQGDRAARAAPRRGPRRRRQRGRAVDRRRRSA